MSPETILYIILTMLSMDNATPKAISEARPHLETLSVAISKGATKDVPATRLIALAYRESRFGYKEAPKGKYPTTSWGACGVFQQVPKFAHGGKTTCAKLGTDLNEAVNQAVATTRYIKRRWKAKSASSLDISMCHYYSGNSCDDNKDGKLNRKDEAYRYGIDHRKARQKAIRLARKGKKVALKGSSKPKTSKAQKRASKRPLTAQESLFSLYSEAQREKYDLYSDRERAERGLPPKEL